MFLGVLDISLGRNYNLVNISEKKIRETEDYLRAGGRLFAEPHYHKKRGHRYTNEENQDITVAIKRLVKADRIALERRGGALCLRITD